MWNSIWSVIKKIDIAAYFCEENCRCCGRAIPSGAEKHTSLLAETSAPTMNSKRIETGPPAICLCQKCSELMWQQCQSLWWMPIVERSGSTTGKLDEKPIVDPILARSDVPLSTTFGTTKLLPVAAATIYKGPMQKLIRRLKYDDDRLVVADIGPLLSRAYEMLLTAKPNLIDDKDDILLVPIPLHPSRQRKRGYNQAALIAKEFAKIYDLRVDTGLLKRTRKTRPQYGLGKQDRLRNIQGAFEFGGNDIRRKKIILVDDVFTSGATLTACASLLTECGAEQVAAMAAARAPYDKKTG
jgi:ComF family protein